MIEIARRKDLYWIGNSKHPQGGTEVRAAAHHQKMRGVENAPGDIDIDIDAAIQIVIHPVINETDTILGLKGKRKDPHEKRAVVAEVTQNISVEAETPPVDTIIPLRRNAQKPRETSNKGLLPTFKLECQIA